MNSGKQNKWYTISKVSGRDVSQDTLYYVGEAPMDEVENCIDVENVNKKMTAIVKKKLTRLESNQIVRLLRFRVFPTLLSRSPAFRTNQGFDIDIEFISGDTCVFANRLRRRISINNERHCGSEMCVSLGIFS